MKLITLAILFLSCTKPVDAPVYSDTWDGTAANQLVTGNAVRDGGNGGSGLFIITTTIPSGLNKKTLTIAELATYTNIPTGNNPLASMPSNRCPTKEEILGVY